MKTFLFIKEHMIDFAFMLLALRVFFEGASIGEAISLLSVVILIVYNKYLNRQTIDNTEELKKKIEDISTKVQSLQIANGMKRTVANEQRR